MDVKKEEINFCINSVKKYISPDKFNIRKIDIDTKLPYYKILVLYSKKDDESQEIFLEYFLEKENNIILHCFSNNLEIKKENEYNVEKYESTSIIKFFYYKDKWITIGCIDDIEKCINNIFNNPKDFYEVLNKNLYYTYIIENNKLKFLSKGSTNDVNQYYNNNIKGIIFYGNKYIFVKDNRKKEYCKYNFNCINPKCIFKHPINYDINTAYKKYIIKEKIKNPKFKSLFCNNSDEKCSNHKYNRCIFKHQNDPID